MITTNTEPTGAELDAARKERDIQAMPASRELDALVAEKVMGWNRWGYRWMPGSDPERWLSVLYPPDFTPPEDYLADFRVADGTEEGIYTETLPRFSAEIAAAMLVVERLHQQGDCVSMVWKAGAMPPEHNFYPIAWEVTFRIARVGSGADTLPLAIARAALAAMRAKDETPHG